MSALVASPNLSTDSDTPGSGEKPENIWPLSHSCCSLTACSGRECRAGAAGQVKGSFALHVHRASEGPGEQKSNQQKQCCAGLPVSVTRVVCWNERINLSVATFMPCS